jgi:hypothetical protein
VLALFSAETLHFFTLAKAAGKPLFARLSAILAAFLWVSEITQSDALP